MATYFLNGCKLWVAQFDVSGDINQVALTHNVEELDVTTFGSSGVRERIGGLEDISLTGGGFWDSDGTDEPDDVFFSRIGGSGEIVTVCPTTGAEGERAYSFDSLHFEYSPEGTVDSTLNFTVGARGRGRLVRGTVLEDATTARTATFNGTGRQLGSVLAAEKVYGFLHVFSASGSSPTLDVVVQSDDNSGFTSATSRLTFTQATGVTSESKSASGAIADDYWRVSATIGGTNPSFTFAVVVGIR